MVRLHVTLVVFSAYLLAGCVGQLSAGARVRAPRAVVVGGPSAGPAYPGPVSAEPMDADPVYAGPVYAADEDRHWMQPDDYFVIERAWRQGWKLIYLAKMKQAPSEGSKGQALFFQVKDSRDLWTEHFWRSRLPRPEDLALGTFAICFHGNSRDRVYRAPTSKSEARTGHWFMGRITDVTDTFKHQVRVSTYDCAIEAVRILEPVR